MNRRRCTPLGCDGYSHDTQNRVRRGPSLWINMVDVKEVDILAKSPSLVDSASANRLELL